MDGILEVATVGESITVHTAFIRTNVS